MHNISTIKYRPYIPIPKAKSPYYQSALISSTPSPHAEQIGRLSNPRSPYHSSTIKPPVSRYKSIPSAFDGSELSHRTLQR